MACSFQLHMNLDFETRIEIFVLLGTSKNLVGVCDYITFCMHLLALNALNWLVKSFNYSVIHDFTCKLFILMNVGNMC